MHFFLFKQKTAYEMRISDWSSDVCSSDLAGEKLLNPPEGKGVVEGRMAFFDVLADARWGGIISGDKVQVEFDSGLDGVRTAIVRSVARYRSEERRVGKESVSTTRFGGSPYHKKKIVRSDQWTKIVQ